MKNLLFFLPVFIAVGVVGCGGAKSVKFDVMVFNPSKTSTFNSLYEQRISAKAAVSDSCVVSVYKLQVFDSSGVLIHESIEEVVPDLSKLTLGSEPKLRDLIDSFDFKTTITILNTNGNSNLDNAEIKLKGIIKLCKDLWGSGGKVSTVTTIFYGNKTVNLNNLASSSDSLCTGEKNCILMEAFTTTLAAMRMTSNIQDFINTADKKDFVPIILTHDNIDCRDDSSDPSGRNIISVNSYIDGVSQPISSVFFAHPDYKYHFAPKSTIDEYNADDIEQIILASVIAGDTYEITFTQGNGTGCAYGTTKTQTIRIPKEDIFDSSGTRTVNSVEVVFDWR